MVELFSQSLAGTIDPGFHGLFANAENIRRLPLAAFVHGHEDKRLTQFHGQLVERFAQMCQLLPVDRLGFGIGSIVGDGSIVDLLRKTENTLDLTAP